MTNRSIKIDLNRGVEMRKHRASGMDIYMYRDTPGVYLNSFEQPVPDALAKEAGFPVDQLARRKFAKDKLDAAMGAIQAELEAQGDEPSIVAERGDYKVLALGLGRANVVDKDGNVLTPQPIPQDYALRLLDELVPETHNAPVVNENKKEKANGRSAS